MILYMGASWQTKWQCDVMVTVRNGSGIGWHGVRFTAHGKLILMRNLGEMWGSMYMRQSPHCLRRDEGIVGRLVTFGPVPRLLIPSHYSTIVNSTLKMPDFFRNPDACRLPGPLRQCFTSTLQAQETETRKGPFLKSVIPQAWVLSFSG